MIELLEEAKRHYEQLAPHAKDRKTSELLKQLIDALDNQWQPIDEFQKLANEGWCWIVYKGRATEAYHDHNQKFKYSRFSEHCYLTECITYVMPWNLPTPPTNKP